MNPRDIKFLEDWIARNVMASDSGETRATILAMQCILEAAQRGIPAARLEEGGRTVESAIMDAISLQAAPG